jgi:hypothetical protein
VGLLYVGAILFLNGVMLLGWVEAKSAAPLNLFVGALQVFTPTYLIVTSGGDADTILAASGIYLFGFTYLYVGINLLGGYDGTGLGWFSLFVAGAAIVYSALNFTKYNDAGFGVIWLYWSFLWALFFVLLGLKRERITRYTGAVAAIEGIVTGAIPAFLLMVGAWQPNTDTAAVVLAVFGIVVFLALIPLLRRGAPTVPAQREPAPAPAEPTPSPSSR